MSKALSLKVRDEIFQELERIIREAKVPRNTYINNAIDFYNKINRRKKLKEQLLRDSKLVRKNSLEVLQEFERLEETF